MSLRIERNLEHFLRLINKVPCGNLHCIEWQDGNRGQLKGVAEVREQALLLSMGVEPMPQRLDTVFTSLFARVRPDWTLGAPVRVYIVGSRVFATLSVPEEMVTPERLWTSMAGCVPCWKVVKDRMMAVLTRWLQQLGQRQDIALGVMLMVAVFMMILPLPTPLLDLLIAINLTFAITLMTLSIYLRDPLDSSVFPSILLITTLYRLALTVSTSRLILLQHDAGEIIFTFGNFVVGGNLVVGLIIFIILTIVQFIVITKGAERVAEVGARFSLDGMPGKQMSIDGDMRAGIIDAQEAKRQRGLVQKESQLYGAMDGAMKFVKGDAIASMIVIVVNILGGIAIGVFQQGMSAGEALHTYAILSVGDGLIVQIPALLISITAGIVVTRIPGDERQNLARELTQQLGRHPRSLWMASGVVLIFAVIPGFPFVVFGSLAAFLGVTAYRITKRQARAGVSAHGDESSAEHSAREAAKLTPGAQPLRMRCAPDVVVTSAMLSEIDRIRQAFFEHMGVPVPEVLLDIDGNAAPGTLEIHLYQTPVLSLTVPTDALLVWASAEQFDFAAEAIKLPWGGMHACWVAPQFADALAVLNVQVTRSEARLGACLRVVLTRHAGEFIGVQESRYLMDAMEGRYSELVRELQRQLPIGRVAEVLERLVAEGVPIRDLRAVFEALIEWAGREKDVVLLTEYVRVALRRHLCHTFGHGRSWLAGFLMGERIETMLRESIRQTSAGSYSALSPEDNAAILDLVRARYPHGVTENSPVLLTAIDVRRYMRRIVEREFSTLPVLSLQELGDDIELKIESTLELIGDASNEVPNYLGEDDNDAFA